MRFPVLAVAALASTLFADPAEARRRGSSAQSMLFVSETQIEIEGQKYALCHLVEDNSVFFVNLFRSLEGYALAANNCASDQYISVTPEILADAKADGMIPASVPDEPKLSTGDMIKGHWGWLLILGVVGFAAYGWMGSRKRRQEREGLMGDASPVAVAILDAMCHAAKADGEIAEEEVVEIARIGAEMTGQSFDAATVRQMANLAEQSPSDNDMKRLAKAVSGDQQMLMMKAVLTVVASDGQLAGKEQEFVGKLAKALKMSGEQVNALLGEVVGAKA